MTLPLFASEIIRLNAIDSTNNFAANLLRTTKPSNGAVILTKSQTKGRGQRENLWESEPNKNLTFSMILYANISPLHSFDLNIFISVSLIEFLRAYAIPAKIKWPNDIYVGKKKIAGILIENSIQGNKIKHSIVGIGINVNQQKFKIKSATSMALELNTENDLEILLSSFLNTLRKHYFQFSIGKTAELKIKYLEELLGLNELGQFNDGQSFAGIIRGVSDAGNLQVEKMNRINEYAFKEIQFEF